MLFNENAVLTVADI
jgi:hypothetical protein